MEIDSVEYRSKIEKKLSRSIFLAVLSIILIRLIGSYGESLLSGVNKTAIYASLFFLLFSSIFLLWYGFLYLFSQNVRFFKENSLQFFFGLIINFIFVFSFSTTLKNIILERIGIFIPLLICLAGYVFLEKYLNYVSKNKYKTENSSEELKPVDFSLKYDGENISTKKIFNLETKTVAFDKSGQPAKREKFVSITLIFVSLQIFLLGASLFLILVALLDLIGVYLLVRDSIPFSPDLGLVRSIFSTIDKFLSI